MSNRKKMKPVNTRRPVTPSLGGLYKMMQELDNYEEQLRQEQKIEEVQKNV